MLEVSTPSRLDPPIFVDAFESCFSGSRGWLGGSGLGALLGTAKPEGGATQFHVAGAHGSEKLSSSRKARVVGNMIPTRASCVFGGRGIHALRVPRYPCWEEWGSLTYLFDVFSGYLSR